jgi:hypothetical protein
MKPEDIIEKLFQNPMYVAAISKLQSEEEKRIIVDNLKDMIGKIYGPLFEAFEAALSNPEESQKLSALLMEEPTADPIVTQKEE